MHRLLSSACFVSLKLLPLLLLHRTTFFSLLCQSQIAATIVASQNFNVLISNQVLQVMKFLRQVEVKKVRKLNTDLPFVWFYLQSLSRSSKQWQVFFFFFQITSFPMFLLINCNLIKASHFVIFLEVLFYIVWQLHALKFLVSNFQVS